MLRLLHIENFAIIDALEVEFGPGLNVLTGETGAGKSIIFDAFHLALGGRAGADLIRGGAREAVVEALFELPATPGGRAARAILEAAGVDPGPGGELIVRRRIPAAGRGRIHINGALATAAALAAVGERLVNIHGQHAHQTLLRPATHLGLLDDFAGLAGERGAVAALIRRLGEAEKALSAHREGARERARRADLLRFQVEELEAAALSPGELAGIDAALPRLRNAERLGRLGREVYERLYEADGAVVERLGETLRDIGQITDLDPAQSALAEEAASALAQVESLAGALRAYTEGIEADPGRLEALESRRARVREMLRKYGDDEAECLAYLDACRAELAAIEGGEETEARLAAEAGRLREEVAARALALSAARREAAARLDREMEKGLAELGLRGAVFQTRLSEARPASPAGHIEAGGREIPLRADGLDAGEFFFSPNPGEPPRPLARTASGGELSRLMLALEAVLRRGGLIPTLVFDEVDAGIGGAVAEVVGRKLRQVSKNHQVLVITHLPQVACLGDRHYRIEKRSAGGRTAAAIAPVEGEARVEEIARMGAGVEITAAARRHAREMLERAGRKAAARGRGRKS